MKSLIEKAYKTGFKNACSVSGVENSETLANSWWENSKDATAILNEIAEVNFKRRPINVAYRTQWEKVTALAQAEFEASVERQRELQHSLQWVINEISEIADKLIPAGNAIKRIQERRPPPL